MAEHPAERANIIGHQLPYHLQYLKDGKPDMRPEGKDGRSVQGKQRLQNLCGQVL